MGILKGEFQSSSFAIRGMQNSGFSKKLQNCSWDEVAVSMKIIWQSIQPNVWGTLRGRDNTKTMILFMALTSYNKSLQIYTLN